MNKNIYTHTTCLLIAFSITIALKAQNVLKVQTGTIISTNGGVVITLKDMDFDNDGIFNQGIGQSIFVFNGTANNIISGSSSPLFDVLQLAKTGSGKVTLQRGIRIGSNIACDGGILNLNAQNILLAPTASLLNESETSHITGTNGGFVQINTTLTAPSAVNPGNLGAEITSTQDLGSVIIRRGHQSQTNVFGNGTTIFRYYDIIPSNNIALNASLRLGYLDAELNSLNENGLTMWTSSDNQHWNHLAFSTRSNTNNYVEQGGINSFNRMTLAEASNPLPLKWGSFNTQCISGQSRITWKTLQEQNTTVFIIRRSDNGSTWTDIGSLPAAGNSQATLSYSYTDPQSSTGTTYYQLVEQDFDGRQAYSPVLASQCEQPENIKAYPNPAQRNCWVSIQSQSNSTFSMRLYNNQGALLKQQTVKVLAGNNVFELSLADYPQGVYLLVFTGNDGKVKVIRMEKI